MHTITTRATQPWKVFKAASLAPKTDEDWHTPNEVNTLFFCFRSPQDSYLEGMYMENIPHHKDFTRSKPGDVSAFLCHFLDGHCIKPKESVLFIGTQFSILYTSMKKVLRATTSDAFVLQLSALCGLYI